jgi:hypothetical protein
LANDSASGLYKPTSRAYGNSETPAVGLLLENTSPATVGDDSASPMLELSGKGWDTTGAGSSVDDRWAIYALPTSGAATNALLRFDFAREGGAYSSVAQLNSSGGVFQSNSLYATTGYIRVAGDFGAGVAGSVMLCNATVAAGGSAPTFLNAPAAAAQTEWVKIYVGGNARVFPVWAAA